MDEPLDIEVGDIVELGGRWSGEWEVISIDLMWGTTYYILRNDEGKTEDFPLSYMHQYMLKNSENKQEVKPSCIHNWLEQTYFSPTIYKTCTKCGAKYEEVYGSK